jgi:hypothetical protein
MNAHKELAQGIARINSAMDGRQAMTARQIIEARLCRDIGPIATMPPDLRKAMSALAKQLQKSKGTK